MDQHQCDELCREVTGNASNAGLRSRYFLYNVQPVSPLNTLLLQFPLTGNSEPIGEHFVQVCTTTPCMLRGSTEILDTVCNHLGGIKAGETTKDKKFTVVEVECQGACSNAPMLVIGDDFYVHCNCSFLLIELTRHQEDLTPESTVKILDAFSQGKKPTPGPQSGRQTSENSAGLTNLTTPVRRTQPHPFPRSLGHSRMDQGTSVYRSLR